MALLNIVVIGTGMYATGRGTPGFGTILPAIIEWQRSSGSVGEVVFVGTSGNSSEKAEIKASELIQQTGVQVNITGYPKGEVRNTEAYRDIISSVAKPACAVIVVPDHLHYQVAHDCLQAGLPVLIVKPLTPTVKEGKSLIDLARKKQLYAAVEFHKRWDKANLLMRDTIQKGRIGDLLYCWVEYSQRKSIPTNIFKEWTEKTSILQYLGIHYIDIVRFYTGAKPKRTMATGQKIWLMTHGLDAYDAIQCVIEWEMPNGSRFTQTVLTNWIDPETSSAMSDQKIKMVGTYGRFESDQKERGITINVDGSSIEQPNPDFCMEFVGETDKKEWRGYGIDSVVSFFTDVVNIIEGRIDVESLDSIRPTFSEALVSTAVVEAAHASLEQNNIWQNISDIH